MFYGQHAEDVYIASLFPSDYIGVCIEVGAYDGSTMSNTYHFEQKGWRALCIEPIPSCFDECRKIRKESINCCIGTIDAEDLNFYIFHIGSNLSAITSLIPDSRLIESHRHLIEKTTLCKVKVRSLNSLLVELNYPIEIDFISIDTENTELDVLKGLDLNKYNVKLFVIENNYDEPACGDYLKQYEYTKINRIAVNDFYIKDTLSTLP